jgi:hypothetical protein
MVYINGSPYTACDRRHQEILLADGMRNGRSRTPFTLTTPFPIQAAWRTNLLEENQEELPVTNRTISAFIKPFQIFTIRIQGG